MFDQSINRKQWKTGEKLKSTKSKVPLDSHNKPRTQATEVLSTVFGRQDTQHSVPSNSSDIPKMWRVDSGTCVKIPFLTFPFVALSKLLNISEALSFGYLIYKER